MEMAKVITLNLRTDAANDVSKVASAVKPYVTLEQFIASLGIKKNEIISSSVSNVMPLPFAIAHTQMILGMM